MQARSLKRAVPTLVILLLGGAALLLVVAIFTLALRDPPEYARPAAIAERFDHELEGLRELAAVWTEATLPKLPEKAEPGAIDHGDFMKAYRAFSKRIDACAAELTDPAILRAAIRIRPGPVTRTEITVKGTRVTEDEGITDWLRDLLRDDAQAEPGRPVSVELHADGRSLIRYDELFFHGPEKEVRGVRLILDLAALAERAQEGGDGKDSVMGDQNGSDALR